jgi:hypothetical protein
VSLCIPSSSRSPDHHSHRTIYYLGYPLGRFAGLKHRQLARQVGVIITTGRIRRNLVNKINLLVDSPRSIEASRLAPAKAESSFLRRASGCFGTSRGSSSTTSPTPRVQVPRHIARLITPLVVDYFAYAARPGASARRAARHPARRRLLHLRRTSGCFGTSRGLSRGSSSITSPRAGSSSTTSPMPRVRGPRHVARLVTRLVVNSFDYAARPGASASRAAHRAARHRLLRLCCASGCLGTSSGSSRGSSSTPSTTPRVQVSWHVARLVVDYFDYAACPVALARRAARRVVRRTTRRRL